MLQVGDDGVVTSVNEEELVYVDKMELEQLIESYQQLENDNKELKQSVNNLKDTIIKITIAYQRKYDRNIVDLVDEIYEEDISDVIKELQVQ